MSCVSDLIRKRQKIKSRDEPLDGWTGITWLLNRHHVSWASYIDGAAEPVGTGKVHGKDYVPSIWNVLPQFTDVQDDRQLSDIKPLSDFLPPPRAEHLPPFPGSSPVRATASIRRYWSAEANPM